MKKGFSIKNMNVKMKITVFSCVSLAFVLILVIAGLYPVNSIDKAHRNRYDHYAMGQFYLSEAFKNFTSIKVCVRDGLFTSYNNDTVAFAEQERKIASYESEAHEDLNQFKALLNFYKPEIRTQYQNVENAIEQLINSANSDLAMFKSGNMQGALDNLMGNEREIADNAEAELEKLINLLEDEAAANSRSVEQMLVLLTTFLIVAAVIAFVIILIYAGLVTKSVTIPVAKLSAASRKMAVGDVDVDCEKLYDDDLGDLLDDFKQMADATRQQAEQAGSVSEGDLTLEIAPRGEKDVLGKAFQKLVTDNNRTLGEIKEATSQVTIGAEQVATASQSLAQGSTEQASALEQVTASVAEIAERTKANASQANEVDTLVHNVKQSAEGGNSRMKDLINAMDEINESSGMINKIIKTIDNIAFQTNILALNAAVEAARAGGSAGKGFGVVAEEVRSLAAKSASAASETAEIIEDSINKVDRGTKIAEETAKSLEEIVDAIEKVVELVDEIATASNDQATAVSQIDQAINQVSTVVQTNSATSEQCAAASEELSNQASHLRELLSSYKLTASKGGSSSSFSSSSSSSRSYRNEQIISLDGEFGKY